MTQSMMVKRSPALRAPRSAVLILIGLALIATACEAWLVEDPALLPATPTSTDTPTSVADETAPTLVPSPTPTITLTPVASPTPPIGPTSTLAAGQSASAGGRDPVVEYFVAFPTEADPGDTVLLFWSTRNATSAAIWRIKDDGTPGRTFPVETEGELSLPALAAGRDEEFVLSITNGHVTVEQRVAVTVSCPLAFFFEPAPEEGCPRAEPSISNAVFQGFERGQVFWIEALGQIAILFSDVREGTEDRPAWLMVVDPYYAGAPNEDPNLIPPENLRQPKGGIGMVWRETPGLRERLGWAIGEEQPYPTVYQLVDVPGEADQLYFTDPIGSVITLVPEGVGWLVVALGQ